jgi:hypothetical protein
MTMKTPGQYLDKTGQDILDVAIPLISRNAGGTKSGGNSEKITAKRIPVRKSPQPVVVE